MLDILETYLPPDGIMAANAIAKLDRWRSERGQQQRAAATGNVANENAPIAAARSTRK